MNMFRDALDLIGNGLNSIVSFGDAVPRSLSRDGDEGLTHPSPVTEREVTLDTLVKFMELLDMDPIQWKDVTMETLQKIVDERGVHCTVDTARAMAPDRFMKNPMENISIGQDTLVYLNAPPQYGKTTTMLFTMWRSGVQHNMPSILFTLDREGESKRLLESTSKFNDFVTVCSELLGMDLSLVPRLVLHDSTVKGDNVKFSDGLKRGLSEEIPFYTFMGNSYGVGKAKRLIRDNMSMHIGRDEEDGIDNNGIAFNDGRMNAMVVVDEADKFIQPGTMVKITRSNGTIGRIRKPGALEESLNGEVSLNRVVQIPHDESRRRRTTRTDSVPVESLFEAFTSVLLVTATPMAFTSTERPIVVRANTEVILAVPSNNYWSPMKMNGWGCKLVENRQVDSPDAMVEHMMSCSTPRHGLVAITSRKSGTILKSSQETMALDDAKKYPGIVSIAWNGDGIKVYTSSPAWVGFLFTTGAFESTLLDNDVTCFTSKSENKKKTEWKDWLGKIDPKTGKRNGGVMNSEIHTYPGLMDFIYSMVDIGANIPHTILYSLNMSARGTPVKGWSHQGVLTDMYVDTGSSGHDEYLIQLAGRIFGIDKRTQEEGKIIWGPRLTLKKLYEAVIAVPFFVSKLKDGVGFPELIRKTVREIYNTNGVMIDTLQVTTKSTVKRTRPGNERSIVHENKEFKRVKGATNTRIERVEFDNKFQNVPIRQHMVPVAQSIPVASPVSSATPVSRSASTMEETWINHEDGISTAMKSVVSRNGGSATSSIMANNLGAEESFPDGTGFDMAAFVRTICTRQDVLLKTGLGWSSGLFSANMNGSRKISVVRSGLTSGLKRHYDECVGAYKTNHLSGWVSRSNLLRMYASGNMQASRGRLSELESSGNTVFSDDYDFLMEKRDREIFIKIR